MLLPPLLLIAFLMCIRYSDCQQDADHIKYALGQVEEDLTYLTATFEDSQVNARAMTQKLKSFVSNVVQTQDEQAAVSSKLQYAISEVAELSRSVEGVQRLLDDLDAAVSASNGFLDSKSFRSDPELSGRVEDMEDTAKVVVEQIGVLSEELKSASRIIQDDVLVKRRCVRPIDGLEEDEYGKHVCDVAQDRVPEHCAELYQLGYREDGVFTTRLGTRFVETLCEMSSDLGGWNVILRSSSRVIVSHEESACHSPLFHFFGNVQGDFWWGFRNILSLVSHKESELAIELAENDTTIFFSSFTAYREGPEYVITLTQDEKTFVRRLITEDDGLRVEESEDTAAIVKETACPMAITRVLYLGSETVTLDVTCLMAAFTGRHVEDTQVQIKVRPKTR